MALSFNGGRTLPIQIQGDNFQALNKSLGNRTYQYTSYQPPTADQRQTRDSDNPGFSTGSGLSVRDHVVSVPLVCRSGTNYLQQDLYANRPKIEVVALSQTAVTGTPNIKARFDSMILSQIQEVDAEKIDVIETFGVPHFFASGRFVRKYTFQGFLRTTAVNYAATKDAVQYSLNQLVVPQTVVFRMFYEEHMRASVQASNGWYTRITVDKEVFEGFVTTFNVSRDAMQDSTSPFVFSMVAFNRYNLELDGKARQIIDASVPGQSQQPAAATAQQQAENQGEAFDSVPAPAPMSGLTVQPDSVNIGTMRQNSQKSPVAPMEVVKLYAINISDMIFVSTDTPGIDAVYARTVVGGNRKGATPLHGSMIPKDGPVEITHRVTNFWALYSELYKRQNKQDYQTTLDQGNDRNDSLKPIDGSVVVTLRTSSGKAAKFTWFLTIVPPESLVVAQVQGMVSSQLLSAEPIPVPSEATGDMVIGRTDFRQFDMLNRLQMDMRYFIAAPDGSEVLPPSIAGATVEFDIKSVVAALGDGLGVVASPKDNAIAAGSKWVISTSTIPLLNESAFQHSFNITPASPTALLQAGAPFEEADRLVISIHPTIKLNGYPAISKLPTFQYVVNFKNSATTSCLLLLKFLGVEWSPTRVTDRQGNNTEIRLDQFGLLKFLITTTDNKPVPNSVMEALKSSALFVETDYSSPMRGNTAVYNNIPLSGKAFGTGMALDQASGSQITIRTQATKLLFQANPAGIYVEIGVNTDHRDGLIAEQYSDRFWDYLSTIRAAAIIIPATAGISPPNAYAKLL